MKSSIVLLIGAATLCEAYDNDIKPCWDIRLDPTSFCYEAVKYPMSVDTFYDTKRRDEEAKLLYN